MSITQDTLQIIGRRHNREDGRDCFCGCQHVIGLVGRIVQNDDTPKLARLGLRIVEFDVSSPAGGPSRVEGVCYSDDDLRDFDLIPGRKYLKVAEWIGHRNDGQRTVRWFKDMTSGVWYGAESWKRPNLRARLNTDQVAYVERITGLAA